MRRILLATSLLLLLTPAVAADADDGRLNAEDAAVHCPVLPSPVDNVRSCLTRLVSQVDSTADVRLWCAGQYYEEGPLASATWQCVDYLVFDRVVCDIFVC